MGVCCEGEMALAERPAFHVASYSGASSCFPRNSSPAWRTPGPAPGRKRARPPPFPGRACKGRDRSCPASEYHAGGLSWQPMGRGVSVRLLRGRGPFSGNTTESRRGSLPPRALWEGQLNRRPSGEGREERRMEGRKVRKGSSVGGGAELRETGPHFV